MALPSSGPIGLYDVRTELGLGSVQIGLTDSNVRTLAGQPSGDVRMPDELYGKSNYPPYGTYLSQYCSGYNLYYRYANGTGGYYDTLQQSNSPTCGWPPPPTYSVTVSPTAVDEGYGVSVSVTTTNFNNGTGNGDLYWRITHINTTESDFSGPTSGVAGVTNNYTSFAYYASADQVTEGNENYYVTLSLTPGGASVATTSTLTINDTSLTPPVIWSLSPANNSVSQEGDVIYCTVTVSNSGNYTAYYRVPSLFSSVTFWNISVNSYNAFNIVNGVGTFELGVNFDTTPNNSSKTFALWIYDSGFNLKTSATYQVIDTVESISGPTTGSPGIGYNVYITNGVPNTSFSWTRSWIPGDTPQTATLDASGSYTFSNIIYPNSPLPFTYSYPFTFAGSGRSGTYSIYIS